MELGGEGLMAKYSIINNQQSIFRLESSQLNIKVGELLGFAQSLGI
jgi:hypothetical protein